MTAALFALLATLLAGIGARDQVLVARIGTAQGPRPALLALALAGALLSAAFAGYVAARLVADFPPPGRPVFVAMALVWAGLEALLLRPRAAPLEPTRSLFAAGVVLLAQQLTDAARFLIIALGVATAQPLLAALGGAMGGMATVLAGWAAPDLAAARWLVPARRAAGAVLLGIGVWTGLAAIVF